MKRVGARVIVLHVANLGLIPAPYEFPKAPLGMLREHRPRNKPRVQPDMAPNKARRNKGNSVSC